MAPGLGIHRIRGPFRQRQLVFLLDQPFATGATAAYSLRLLRAKHSGGLLRLRADDSGTHKGEADVLPILQPDGSKIITLNSPIENFSGTPFSGDNYVLADLVDAGNNNYDGLTSSWYDQSGNDNDASNSTASQQPQIVSSGTVIKENSKPAVEFDGSDDNLVANNLTTGTQPITEIAVSKLSNNADLSNIYTIFSGANSSNRAHIFIESSKFSLFAGSLLNGSSADTSKHLFFALFNSTNSELYIDGTQDVTGNAGINNLDTTIEIGSQTGNSFNWNGVIQEILYYVTDQTSNRTDIETNINNHYSIF